MNTANMRHKDLTFNISGNRVRLRTITQSHPEFDGVYEIRIDGLIDKTLFFLYRDEESMSREISALSRLFHKLYQLKPEAWGNSKGVMSRSEKRLMRLAILLVGISVLTCLVFLLIQLFK